MTMMVGIKFDGKNLDIIKIEEKTKYMKEIIIFMSVPLSLSINKLKIYVRATMSYRQTK